MSNYLIKPESTAPLNATISTIPGDKSISHRAVIVGSLSNDTHIFTGFLCSDDCLNTVSIFQQLGVKCHVDIDKKTLSISGVGLFGLNKPSTMLDVGNSGTGIRLISGLLAAQPFQCTISGDDSIQKRPMKRIIEPLSIMSASIEGQLIDGKDDLFPPLKISGNPHLTTLGNYTLSLASAQVKSALIFASLYAKSDSVIRDKELTRNHTELMLSNCTSNVTIGEDHAVHIKPFKNTDLLELPNRPIPIPSDFSSAAFFIVYALTRPDTTLVLKNIGLNPTRSKLIDILISMGASITITDKTEDIEPIGTITVKTSSLTNREINKTDQLPFF